ncbi:hypothetical protein Vadar_006170 [Vaccinium darrowii]|uniref:Uncharacterized protein n=1 Tax=Vaccinium darrowii TaxID=229202 RepID=A0ACB7WYB1_9ERIC|nr:hypothetical protein Vadar_006170 [Vaccinium darrowii]
MKLGLDRRTGLQRFLTSWKSRDDPGTGEYTYRVEPNELPQLILFKGSTRVWRVTACLQSDYRATQEATPTFIFNGTCVNNRDEAYTFYTLINASNVSTHFLDELGSLKMVTWVGKWVEFYSLPDGRCDYYSRCGMYGYCDSNNGREFECTCLPGYKPRSTDEWYLRDATGGCIRKREALSMCGSGEGFVKVANSRIPDTSKARVWMNRSVQECKEECVRNCSCLAYTSDAEGGARANCITWYETLIDVGRIPKAGVDLYVRVDAVELAEHMKSRRLNGKMVAVVVTSAVSTSVLIITLVFWLVMKKRRRGQCIKDSEEENVELSIFDMVTIAGATNNFSDKNKIGEGGFGSVYKTYVSGVSFSARLLDSGNLVLFQGDSGNNGVVWQSFDHPTNTMLPNMKLGLDRRTGFERFLTTWKSRDDPGTGEYSYRIEPNELPQIVLFKGSTRVWRIPAWLESQGRAKHEATPTIILNGTYVNNRDEVSTFYTLINASNVSMLFLDELGSLKIVMWVGKWVEFYSIPEDRCDYYSRCGVYGYCDSNNGRQFDCTCLPGYKPRSTDELYKRDASGGCIRKREALSMCGNGEGFVKVANARIPDTFKARVWMNRTMDECKEECMRNCSCMAYTSDAERGTRANCITWYETLMDVRQIPKGEGGVDLYVRVDAVELAQHMESRRLNGKMVAVVVTSAVLTSVLTITLVFWSVMKKQRRGLGIKDSEEENVELPIFDMVTIARATNHFSEKHKIGEGGFGSVYKVIFLFD